MKNVFCVLLLFVAVSSMAQDFKKFRVGLGLGYGSASGNGSSGGVILTLEPSYRLKDNLSIGLRMETALLTRGFSGDTQGASIDVAAIGSYTVNGQYYFSNNKFRPFVGAGLGIYSLAAISASIASQSSQVAASESKFGFYPRVGFDAGHFTAALDYNFIPATKAGTGEFNNSYLGIRIGVYFGGGKKK